MEMTFADFRKRFGLTLYEVHKLDRMKIIKIFQGGYRGHACCHPKKIRCDNIKRMQRQVCIFRHVEEPDHEYQFVPVAGSVPSPDLMKRNMPKKNLPWRCSTSKLRKGDLDGPIRSLWIIEQYIRK